MANIASMLVSTSVPALVTNAETAVLTSPAVTYDQPNPYVGAEHSGGGGGVRISGNINVTVVGAGSTNIFVKVRQGTIAGPVVNSYTYNVSVAPGSTYNVHYDYEDTTRYAAGGGVYVTTVQMNNATANSTIGIATQVVQGQ